MDTATQDRRSLYLMLSIILFLVLSSFTGNKRAGEIVLAVPTFAMLIAATLQLSEKKSLRKPSIFLAGVCMLVVILGLLYPSYPLRILSWIALAGFFGYVSVSLFSYLDRRGPITTGRLYASASLYFMLGIFYSTLFNLLETWQPGSFRETALPASAPVLRHALLYMSLATLTTLGYGDIVPVSELARILAVLEAATGVLYIAITVARLVAAYQRTDGDAG